MDRGPLVVRLEAPARGVPVAEAGRHRCQDVVRDTDGLPQHQGTRVLQGLTDALAARDLAHSLAASVVRQDHDVAREEGRVRTAEVEQHAVVPGDRDDAHLRDPGAAWNWSGRLYLRHRRLPATVA
jgi:hypothetical protein